MHCMNFCESGVRTQGVAYGPVSYRTTLDCGTLDQSGLVIDSLALL